MALDPPHPSSTPDPMPGEAPLAAAGGGALTWERHALGPEISRTLLLEAGARAILAVTGGAVDVALDDLPPAALAHAQILVVDGPTHLTLSSAGRTGVLLVRLATDGGRRPPTLLSAANTAAARDRLHALTRDPVDDAPRVTLLAPEELADIPRSLPGAPLLVGAVGGSLTVDRPAGPERLEPGTMRALRPREPARLSADGDAVALLAAGSGSLDALRHHLPEASLEALLRLADLCQDAIALLDGASSLRAANVRGWALLAPRGGAGALDRLGEADRVWLAGLLAGALGWTPQRRRIHLHGARVSAFDAVALPWSGVGDTLLWLLHLRPAVDPAGADPESAHRRALLAELPPLPRVVERLAGERSWILAWGAPGSGRHLLARALHDASPWASGPMAHLDARDLSPEALGAVLSPGQPGRLDLSLPALAGRTLVVNGLATWSPADRAAGLQMLSALARRPEAASVRGVVLLETRPQRGLDAGRVEDGLSHRGPFAVVHVPDPLGTDGAAARLLEILLQRAAARLGVAPPRVTPEAVAALVERRSVRLQALAQAAGEASVGLTGGALDREALERLLRSEGEPPASVPTLFEAEGQAVRRALAAAGGNKLQAARLLGITRARLYRKMAEHHLDDGAR